MYGCVCVTYVYLPCSECLHIMNTKLHAEVKGGGRAMWLNAETIFQKKKKEKENAHLANSNYSNSLWLYLCKYRRTYI